MAIEYNAATASPAPTKTPEQMVEIWKERIEKAEQASRPINMLSRKSIAFYMGHQWIVPMGDLYEDYRSVYKNIPTYQRQETFNYLAKLVDSGVARKLLDEPRLRAIPPSNDPRRINACQHANHLIQFWEFSQNMANKRQRAALLQELTGMGYWKVFWDRDMEAEIVEVAGQIPQKRIVGDVAIHVISPVELLIEPGHLNTDDATWFVHRRLVNRDYIKTNYQYEPAAPNTEDIMKVRAASRDAPIYRQTERINDDYDRKNFVLVNETYEKQTVGDHYEYQINIIVDNRVIGGTRIQYNPFVPIPYQIIDGITVPITPIFDMLGIQMELNRAISRIAEHHQICTHPQYWKDKSTQITRGEIGTEPGAIVEGIGRQPQPFEHPTLTPDAENYPEKIMMLMQSRYGMHQPSQGIPAYSGSSGVLVQTLTAQDTLNLQTSIKNFKNSYLKAFTLSLKLAQMNYNEKRHFAISDARGFLDVRDFMGSDLEGGIDLRLVTGDNIPMSPSEKREFCMTLFQQGVFAPEKQKERRIMFKFLDFGEIEEKDTLEAERDNAELENRNMEQGQPQTVYIFELHDVHIENHESYMRTMKFKLLPPNIQPLFVQHWNEHRIAQMSKAVQDAQALSFVQMAAQAQPFIMPSFGGGNGGGAGLTPFPAPPPSPQNAAPAGGNGGSP